MNLPTHETRAERYVALLRERFGPDAADRVDPAEVLPTVQRDVCSCENPCACPY
jgi:hypothetical protein